MFVKHGNDEECKIMTVVKTAEDLEREKELAKKAKADVDAQMKTAEAN